MNPDQADYVRTRVVDLRSRLQDIKSLLHAVASTGGIESRARDDLGIAIGSIQDVSEDLAALCGEPQGDPADRSFLETRAKEAKSEVDSGEFDMHG